MDLFWFSSFINQHPFNGSYDSIRTLFIPVHPFISFLFGCWCHSLLLQNASSIFLWKWPEELKIILSLWLIVLEQERDILLVLIYQRRLCLDWLRSYGHLNWPPVSNGVHTYHGWKACVCVCVCVCVLQGRGNSGYQREFSRTTR